jgi:hypothetical protein
MPIGNGIITGNAINYLQVQIIIRGIEFWQKFGMALARNAKPAHLRSLATAYTGKEYARSDKGLTAARADLIAFLDGKAPDDVMTRKMAAAQTN